MSKQKIGTVDEVRRTDRISIERYGVPSLSLMDGAAEAVFRFLLTLSPRGKTVCILAGKGNNAGDGFALARKLRPVVSKVTVILLADGEMTADAKHYYDACIADGIECGGSLPKGQDIYVDAVFGTGFRGDLPENVRAAFEKISAEPAIKVSIDVPSGISGDGQYIADGAFRADHTVTFQILKLCHILPKSAAYCGTVSVGEIGLPAEAIEEAGITTEILECPQLPRKDETSHKTTNGTLLSIVGSRAYQGAATLSLLSAFSGGCGLVVGVIPDGIYPAVAAKVTGAVLCDLPSAAQGGIDAAAFRDAFEDITDRRPTAVLTGSGMGVSADTAKIVARVLRMPLPAVIDGDGLRYVKNLRNREAETVLTPHIGEFARMTGRDAAEVCGADRLTIARDFAKENRCVLVLKDHYTVIASPDGRAFLHCAPNAGLAKGGSGDVLAGLIASFLAQGTDAVTAAKCGVWYHSLAGRAAVERRGVYAVRPEDVIESFGEILRS